MSPKIQRQPKDDFGKIQGIPYLRDWIYKDKKSHCLKSKRTNNCLNLSADTVGSDKPLLKPPLCCIRTFRGERTKMSEILSTQNMTSLFSDSGLQPVVSLSSLLMNRLAYRLFLLSLLLSSPVLPTILYQSSPKLCHPKFTHP